MVETRSERQSGEVGAEERQSGEVGAEEVAGDAGGRSDQADAAGEASSAGLESLPTLPVECRSSRKLLFANLLPVHWFSDILPLTL